MYCDEVLYKGNRPLSKKWHHFENILPSHAERFTCCALTIRYITYSMVGRSIASISDLVGYLPWRFESQSNILAIDHPTILYIVYIQIRVIRQTVGV